jgi:hypothetical protein
MQTFEYKLPNCPITEFELELGLSTELLSLYIGSAWSIDGPIVTHWKSQLSEEQIQNLVNMAEKLAGELYPKKLQKCREIDERTNQLIKKGDRSAPDSGAEIKKKVIAAKSIEELDSIIDER